MSSDTATTAHESARRGRTRERLMDAALAVFVETGVHAASVEQITERADFTRGAFYSNFTSKEELFFALMQRENGARIADLTAQMDETVPRFLRSGVALTEESLSDVILDFLQGPVEDARRWSVVVSEFQLLAVRDPAIAERFVAFTDAFDRQLVEIVEGALAQVDRVFAIDPMTAVRLICSVHDDAITRSILGADSDERVIARLRESLSAVVVAISRPNGR